MNSVIRVEQVRRHRGDRGRVAEQQLAGAQRGHQDGAGGGHLAQHRVVGERAVFDAVDPGLDRVLDAAASAWQWAATCLWLSWAISTAARNSSSVNWMARESSVSDDSIAPVAITLIRSAPFAS